MPGVTGDFMLKDLNAIQGMGYIKGKKSLIMVAIKVGVLRSTDLLGLG